jgi:adenosylcobinamide-phosphate synthase
MYFELALLAYLTDRFLGELPIKHPVIWMGEFISSFEKHFYSDSIVNGTLLVISLILVTLLFSLLLVYCSHFLPSWLAMIFLAVLASTGLAMNMLHQSVNSVLTADDPAKAVAQLVSRDTRNISETEIIKAALETWAENLGDGIIAPLFYLVLFGLPGIAVYKAINTLDSMIGYKTPRYFYFGKVAARLDDVANFIPARITALLIIALAENKVLAWQCCWRDGNKLESPNAGFPIAALAGSLGIQLGGDASYHGKIKYKPVLGEDINPVNKMVLVQGLNIKTYIDIVLLSVLLTADLISRALS